MVSKLMEGLEGTSSMAANVDGAATFFTSTSVFVSGWPSDAVKTSGAGASSDFGSGSVTGCVLSANTQRKTVTVISI